MPAYSQVKFLTSAHQARQFPADTGVEVSVAGRSNAGKSSAINAITGRKGLAKTSKTPGATRLINFFELDPDRRLVDLPGYGFAAVSGEMRRHWGELISGYFAKRRSLRGTVVVMDVRHPLTANDCDMLDLALSRQLPVHVLLTKADKLGRSAGKQALAGVRREVGDGVTVQLFSAVNGEGLDEARRAIERMLEGRPEKKTPVGPADPTGEGKPGVGG
ncbi:MAG: YihA family ribosome biogenesis GTP-binding protein [Chloroflexi bacterium]|nr:YihA family ribosome biogenesis GTP-binding protein [Chloroflexota bacterium]